jgi:signal transduction histidine kinase
MKSIIFFFIFSVLIFSQSLADTKSENSSIITKHEKEWIKKHPVIRVANETDWPPFDYNESGIPKGLVIDHIKLLAKKTGIKLEFIHGYTWSELIDLFQQGKIDVMPVFYHNAEREKYTLYTQAFYKGKLGIFTTTDNKNFNLLNKRVGMERSHGSIPIVRQRIPGVKIIEVDKKVDLVRKLATKQLDAIIGNPFVFYYIARESQIDNILLSDYMQLDQKEQSDTSFHIGVRKDWPILHQILQKGMQDTSDEEMNLIKDQWADITIVKQTNWVLIAQVLGVIVLIIIFLLWNIKILKTMVKAKTQELISLNKDLEFKITVRTQELLTLTAELEKKVEERTEDYKKAKEEAEHANLLKSEFLANISHELRTPMHGILSFSKFGIIKLGKISEEKKLRYFEQINKSGVRLMNLLDNLLDLSRLEAGKEVYKMEPVNIWQMLKDAVSGMGPIWKEKNLKIKVEDPKVSTKIMCDKYKLNQVIDNLLSNAIKFTPADKQIFITLSSGEFLFREEAASEEMVPSLTISIIDEGVGIPKDELESVFDKFIQSTKTKTGAGGTGLGLAICREIINAHHGIIWAENNQEGGTTFSFLLPFKQN